MIELQSIFPVSLQDKLRAVVTTVTDEGNLAAHVHDDPAQVIYNRRRLMRNAALPRAPEWLQQVHGTHVATLSGPLLTATSRVADASITDQLNRPCAILTADCLPVLFYQDDGNVIAAAHAGWRGLAKGVLQNTLAQFNASADNIHAWIGPAISQRHFQIGDDVRDVFIRSNATFASFFVPDEGVFNEPRWRCDLSGLAAEILRNYGVASVQSSNWCSFADSARWFSYRRDANCGRMATLIWKT